MEIFLVLAVSAMLVVVTVDAKRKRQIFLHQMAAKTKRRWKPWNCFILLLLRTRAWSPPRLLCI